MADEDSRYGIDGIQVLTNSIDPQIEDGDEELVSISASECKSIARMMRGSAFKAWRQLERMKIESDTRLCMSNSDFNERSAIVLSGAWSLHSDMGRVATDIMNEADQRDNSEKANKKIDNDS